jgi:hypothetical protein
MALDLRQGDIEDLDRHIKQWYTEVPAEVQLDLPDWDTMPRHLQPPAHSQKDYNVQRLQIWTYLRLNQIRTWLHMPILHTHSSIIANLPYAERAVRLAKNTIKYLSYMNNTTNLYRKLQVFYHQFLTSAIAVLFLASCHAPVNFSASCRDEFYMALELVKDLSSKSWVSQRLWRTIKSLKEVAPRLGLAEAEDPHSTAALTMAGLATGHMAPTPPPSSSTPFSRPIPTSAPSVAPPIIEGAQNGWQISTEMSKIFEGYMGMSGFPPVPVVDDIDPSQRSSADMHQAVTPDDGGTPMSAFGVRVPGANGGSVYSHFRDMF